MEGFSEENLDTHFGALGALSEYEGFGEEEEDEFNFGYVDEDEVLEPRLFELDGEELVSGINRDKDGWVFEYTGEPDPMRSTINPAFTQLLNMADGMRGAKVTPLAASTFYNDVNNLPVGHSFPNPFNGRSLGEVVDIYHMGRVAVGGPNRLNGTFYRGGVMRFKLVFTKGSKVRSQSVKEIMTNLIPLDRITPDSDLVEEGGLGIRSQLRVIKETREFDEAEAEGSEWNMLVLDVGGEIFRKYEAGHPGLFDESLYGENINPDGDPRFRGIGRGGRLTTGGFSELLPTTTMRLVRPVGETRYELIIPGGPTNCVDNCIVEFMRREQGICLKDARCEVGVVIKELEEKYIEEREEKAREKGKTPSPKNKLRQEFKAKMRDGYSYKFFRLVKKAWVERGYNIRMMHHQQKFREGKIYYECSEAAPKVILDPEGKDILLFRIDFSGSIYYQDRNCTVKDSDGLLGKTLHAILLYPCAGTLPMDVNGIWKKQKLLRNTYLEAIEEETRSYMKKASDRSLGLSTHINFSLFEGFVKSQELRYKHNVVDQLFYTPPAKKYSSRPHIPVWELHGDNYEPPLVVAYDIETVKLSIEAIQSGRVDTSVLYNYSPDIDYEKYSPEHQQVPFSVQWVPVNLSDEGEFLDSKLKAGKRVIEYYWLGNPLSEFRTKQFITAKGKKFITGESVMLDVVRTVYGKDLETRIYPNLIGECVNSFIRNISEYAISKGFKKDIFLYAHNGCGFDTFVIEAFCTEFKFAKRLKTGRGILSLIILYPYTEEETEKEKTLRLHFRDTKVFLNQSLANICADFSVPKEWCKLDFPITRVNWKNCYEPEILDISEPYGENDVRALAFVVKQINRMITFPNTEVIVPAQEDWLPGMAPPPRPPHLARLPRKQINKIQPISLQSPKPPIVHYLTFMSVVKKMLNGFFNLLGKEARFFGRAIPQKPLSIDLPQLRSWINQSQLGGRASPYARGYMSSYFPEFLMAVLSGRGGEIVRIANEAIAKGFYQRILDVTSLYPYAMESCDMPTGTMRAIHSEEECLRLIQSVGCVDCETLLTICPAHKASNSDHIRRPFAVIVVKDIYPSDQTRAHLRHQVGRKLHGGHGGIQYTLETMKEIRIRLGADSKFDGYQAYTNIDLYWMLKSGFVVTEYLGGLVWNTTNIFAPLVKEVFEKRVEVKKTNQCLQETLKLFLNGKFGVHSQKVIDTEEFGVVLPSELKHCSPNDPRLQVFLTKNHSSKFDSRHKISDISHFGNGISYVKLKFVKGNAESVGGFSPNHIGSAVLSWSRHCVNLLMFHLPERECLYSDTDSLCISGSSCEELERRNFNIIDPSGTVLGLYKNDYAKQMGEDASVLFSAIGAKKVKLHIITNRKGELYISNTYKGFLGQGVCPTTGKKFSIEKIKHSESRALLEIFFEGVPAPHVGTRWGRSDAGISTEDVTFSSESATYLNFCKGFTVSSPYPDAKGFVSYVVPFGSSYCSEEIIEPVEIFKKSFILPPRWKEMLHEKLGPQVTLQSLTFLLDRFYKDSRDGWFYSPKEIEERVKYNAINAVFDRVAAELEEE